MKLFSLACALVSVFHAATAMAVAVGIYSGTFDPPTQTQLRMIRCALGDIPGHRECEAMGKQISRLVVLVNDDREKDTLASSRERVLMLKKDLQKHGNRVEIVAATSVQSEERKRALLADRNVDRLFQLVSGDAYKVLRFSPGHDDAKIVWIIFPLEEERGGFKVSPETGDSVGFGAMEVIEKLSLYQDIGEDLAELQRSLFEEGWKDFLEDLKLACPTTINDKNCVELASHWDAIPVVTTNEARRKGSSAKIQLIYTPSQSEDRWAEKFVETALQFVRGAQDYNELKAVADDMAARVLQGYPYGRLPHLRRVSVKRNTSSIPSFKVSQKPVACSTPQGSYTFDMDQYLADRFPRAFSAFLKKRAGGLSSLPIPLYVHNHPLEEAYEFHRRNGYATFYFVQTRRGQGHRDIYLAVKSNPRAYRVVFASVRGNDRRANVLCQIHRTKIFSSYRSVESRQEEQSLFVFNPRGSSLKLDENDWLLFGFKGNWARRLRAQNWQQEPLVREGLDIDLFTHPTIKRKLVVARNVYGDDGEIILDTFYKKGMRRMLYLGSAGAIADYRVGDIVIPNAFTDPHHNVVSFEKNFARAHQSELANLLNVYVDKKQGWVQSLFDETRDLLLDWRARSVVAVDIEGLHLAKFAKAHPDLQMAALFVISDQTLGETTIEETMAVRGLIDESMDKVMSVIFPQVVNSD